MKQVFKQLFSYMDNFKIRRKLLILYIFCVLVPLFVTDGFVISIVLRSELATRQHNMESIANAVSYSFSNSVNNVASVAKSMYMNKYINEFLDKEYESPLDYVMMYQQFFKNTLFDNGYGTDNITVTMYTDNDTVVRGGKVGTLNDAKGYEWYEYLQQSDLDRALYYTYDSNRSPIIDAKRKILFIQKMDFYKEWSREKILTIEVDYSSIVRGLEKMNYDMRVYICNGDKIMLSNGSDNSVGKSIETFDQHHLIGYQQDLNLYGLGLKIYVLKSEVDVIDEITRNIPIVLFLVLVNIILPFILVWGLNHSFTVRIGELSKIFRKVDDDMLVKIDQVKGKDEISSLMYNYNKMVDKTNALIQTVYISKMKEQETTVARKNAELLALHSQINPHFLFNALESIRMHSVIKKEFETADMVERLAVMQRQYLEWGNDLIEVWREMEFVEAYLQLQKYRFGDKLSYELQVNDECKQCRIPKLTIVTFVENACVHGIESKSKPGWIFVRVFPEDNELCFEIEDTGNGMDESFREDLEKKMQNANIDMLKDKGRVGIINACLRLKMFSSHQATFEIDSEEGVGTLIQMKIANNCINE